MTRVAVCSRSFSKHPVLRAELLNQYAGVTFNDGGISLSGDDLIDFLSGHEKAIIGLEVLDEAVFSALPELKVISKYGVGTDKMDFAAMVRHGVKLGWQGGVNRRSVCELVIAFAISLLRHLPEANAAVRGNAWRQVKGRQLSDRTVGIVGCGHVGKDLAVLLRAFGCRVIANDIRDFPEFYAGHCVNPCGLEELLKTADIVTLHLPLDGTTENILNAERLEMMKRGAILINTARGGLVDERKLKSMLMEEGRLSGAAFDVFATEPPDDPELVNMANFIATPHIGGSAEEAILAMGRAAIKGLDDNRLPEPGVYPC